MCLVERTGLEPVFAESMKELHVTIAYLPVSARTFITEDMGLLN